MMASLLAASVVALHIGFVGFVILGGLAFRRAEWLVWLHAPALLYAILVQSIGWSCPLTDLEKLLRTLAGETPYAGEFLPHYLWRPLGLTGTEPLLGIGLLALLVGLNLRPYSQRLFD
jgi:hypothetical protein